MSLKDILDNIEVKLVARWYERFIEYSNLLGKIETLQDDLDLFIRSEVTGLDDRTTSD